ncbi:MAG TPA: thiamine pyrophosphate-dependent enzyme [Xanthobacteraceae bacterium]|jgi:acetolactate synthase-1/2/3 large subunit
MKNYLDGGEAILEAFRKLKIDYIMSSPGSEWSPIWEALARQQLDNKPGPTFIESWHETLAVNMATGYTLITGRPQAVLLHAGVGMLQGSMGVHGAMQNEVPMVVMSGESQTLGEDPDLDIEQQWYGGLTVGGIERFVEPFAKWARAVTSPHTLYESVIRAGEMAQRVPKGPIYLNVALEHMLHDWTPPALAREVPPAPVVQPRQEDVATVAELLRKAKSPIIVTETAGRDPEAFSALVELADLLAIPVTNGRVNAYTNFPTDHPLYLGLGNYKAVADADLVLLVGGRAPWYPARRRPTTGKIVAIHDNPLKGHMVYQNLHADIYLEGGIAEALKLLVAAVKSGKIDAEAVKARRQRVAREHDSYVAALRAEREKAQNGSGIDPLSLMGALGEVMPADTIYVDETITHSPMLRQHLPQTTPQSFFRGSGGLGQGIGTALGIKLAAPQRPVALLVGDGSFLYNPIVQALGASKRHDLPIMIIILNNQKYEAMRKGHVHHYPDGASASKDLHFGVTIEGPDYERLGSHFGFHGERVEKLADLKGALQKALAATKSGKTAILNVVVTR